MLHALNTSFARVKMPAPDTLTYHAWDFSRMQDFSSKLAVITGGAMGIGRGSLQLADEGAHVALCDVDAVALQETELCSAKGVTASTFQCDVSNETQVLAFSDHVADAHRTDHIHLLFNNAGIGGGGSFVNDTREDWSAALSAGRRLPLRARVHADVGSATEARIVNTSSINGFWASLGSGVSHTAYSAAKFAVKGFSEALITDLRLNAPHVKVSVVMPGHVGTDIRRNSLKAMGRGDAMDLDADTIAHIRKRLVDRGMPVDNLPDDAIRQMMEQLSRDFKDEATLTQRRHPPSSWTVSVMINGASGGRRCTCAGRTGTHGSLPRVRTGIYRAAGSARAPWRSHLESLIRRVRGRSVRWTSPEQTAHRPILFNGKMRVDTLDPICGR